MLVLFTDKMQSFTLYEKAENTWQHYHTVKVKEETVPFHREGTGTLQHICRFSSTEDNVQFNIMLNYSISVLLKL